MTFVGLPEVTVGSDVVTVACRVGQENGLLGAEEVAGSMDSQSVKAADTVGAPLVDSMAGKRSTDASGASPSTHSAWC